MATIFHRFCENKNAFINPCDTTEKIAGLEEIIALGAEKIIQFGCCGILNQSIADGKIIIPSSAVRDEGTRYHYVPGSEEIYADTSSVDIAAQCLKRHNIPYAVGKIWTTDAIYVGATM